MTLREISNRVRSLLPPSFDIEDIASEIWLRCWIAAGRPSSDDVPVSREALYGRCIDVLRKHSLAREVAKELFHLRRPDNVPDRNNALLDKIIRESNLSDFQMSVIFQCFYLGRSIEEGSSALRVSESLYSRTVFLTLEQLKMAARRISNVSETEW